MPNDEFSRFLEKVARANPGRQLHTVADNYTAQNHSDVDAWLGQEAAYQLSFHPGIGLVAQPRRGLLRDLQGI